MSSLCEESAVAELSGLGKNPVEGAPSAGELFAPGSQEAGRAAEQAAAAQAMQASRGYEAPPYESREPSGPPMQAVTIRTPISIQSEAALPRQFSPPEGYGWIRKPGTREIIQISKQEAQRLGLKTTETLPPGYSEKNIRAEVSEQHPDLAKWREKLRDVKTLEEMEEEKNRKYREQVEENIKDRREQQAKNELLRMEGIKRTLMTKAEDVALVNSGFKFKIEVSGKELLGASDEELKKFGIDPKDDRLEIFRKSVKESYGKISDMYSKEIARQIVPNIYNKITEAFSVFGEVKSPGRMSTLEELLRKQR